jgi:hypothetical protein
MSSVTENALREIASAYAQAVGILSGTMKVLIEPAASYTEQEKIELMKKALKEADEVIAKA